MSKFGEKIMDLRVQKKLNTKEVARAVSIPQSRYSELEKGVRVPTDSQISRMEEYFGIPSGELVKLINPN
ncbi:MAG: helix-turn-helix domain-containing protein [Desulfobacterales bacterium]|jgi:transcriptional regulator with XRE-family HTH domain|nr:helix-turn-helix domain-containing protein [Desulfobacterales bacterium]